MQIVIDIPETIYKAVISNNLTYGIATIFHAIRNGTPLPKGHGELKDADEMINKLCTHEASELFGSVTCAEILEFINDEKPIVEADKAGEEE